MSLDALGPPSGPAASGCPAAAILSFASFGARRRPALPLARFRPRWAAVPGNAAAAARGVRFMVERSHTG